MAEGESHTEGQSCNETTQRRSSPLGAKCNVDCACASRKCDVDKNNPKKNICVCNHVTGGGCDDRANSACVNQDCQPCTQNPHCSHIAELFTSCNTAGAKGICDKCDPNPCNGQECSDGVCKCKPGCTGKYCENCG